MFCNGTTKTENKSPFFAKWMLFVWKGIPVFVLYIFFTECPFDGLHGKTTVGNRTRIVWIMWKKSYKKYSAVHKFCRFKCIYPCTQKGKFLNKKNRLFWFIFTVFGQKKRSFTFWQLQNKGSNYFELNLKRI